MKLVSSWVLPAVAVFAVLTGILAWNAGFFSPTNRLLPPGEDPMLIQGVDWQDAQKIQEQLILTGFMEKGDTHVAIINSQVVAEGEILTVDAGATRFELIVKVITAERVILAVE